MLVAGKWQTPPRDWHFRVMYAAAARVYDVWESGEHRIAQRSATQRAVVALYCSNKQFIILEIRTLQLQQSLPF